MLSQAALRKRSPVPDDPAFQRRWEGLSIFDNEEEVRDLGRNRRRRGRPWSLGEYIATLSIPDDAPITCEQPVHEGGGHWLLYDDEGRMLDEDDAPLLLRYVVSVVHGPSTDA